jgi:predicted patatin/cPLA2 family phospholipase
MISVAIQGGAMRSIYCLGVIRALSETPYLKDVKEVYTSSAGCVSAAVLADQLAATPSRSVAEIGEDLVSMLAGPRFINESRLLKIVDVDYLVSVIGKVTSMTPQSLAACSLVFEVALTNAETAVASYVDVAKCLSTADLHNALRASMAIPVLYPHPVTIGATKFVDGGIADPLPALRAMSRSPETLIGISSVPRGTLAEPAEGKEALILKLMPAIAPLVRRLMLTRNPLADAVDHLLDQKSLCGTRVVRVSPSNAALVGSRLETDKKKLFALEELGYKDGVKAFAVLAEMDSSQVSS